MMGTPCYYVVVNNLYYNYINICIIRVRKVNLSRLLRTALFHLQFCWFWEKRRQSSEFALYLVLFLHFDCRL